MITGACTQCNVAAVQADTVASAQRYCRLKVGHVLLAIFTVADHHHLRISHHGAFYNTFHSRDCVCRRRCGRDRRRRRSRRRGQVATPEASLKEHAHCIVEYFYVLITIVVQLDETTGTARERSCAKIDAAPRCFVQRHLQKGLKTCAIARGRDQIMILDRNTFDVDYTVDTCRGQ